MHRPTHRLTGTAVTAGGALLAAGALLLSTTGASRAAAPAPVQPAAAHTAALTATAASSTTISLRKTSIGTILVGPGNETLYAFSKDKRNRDVCATIRKCLSAWPMLTVHGTLTAGRGVQRSLLSTITVHGAHQVTYAGHPLYSYAEDTQAGDVGYVGATQFGGSWPALTAKAHLVQ